MQTLYFRGEDVGEHTYWSWEWASDGRPDFVVLDHADVAGALSRLDRALPGILQEEAELTASRLAAAVAADETASRLLGGTGRLPTPGDRRAALMASRCLTGGFADRGGEQSLCRALAAALLPERMVAQIRERAGNGSAGDVEVRVLPAPSCVRVPWEILVVGEDGSDERLLDLAHVVTMAPVLGRDGDVSIPHPDWAPRSADAPLLVIDPRGPGGSVLTADAHDEWHTRVEGYARRHGLATDDVGVVREERDRDWLSEQLNDIVRSRFMYVGHVEAGEATAGKTALVLSDPHTMYGLGHRVGDYRYLTAQDLFAGTQGHDVYVRNLSNTRGATIAEVLTEEFGGAPTFPKRAVDADGEALQVAGRDLWPMPPRVALIACQSGSDFAHAEPFGLVTSLLEAGAELVTATRWVLLTDVVFRSRMHDASPLNDMALAVDLLHQGEDPLAGLAQWKRERLEAWRSSGALADSPLTWAALTNYHAPDRTIRTE